MLNFVQDSELNTELAKLAQLPSRTPLDVALKYGYIPVTSSTWYNAADFKRVFAEASRPTGVLAWFDQHQTAVLIAAAGVFLLALARGGGR